VRIPLLDFDFDSALSVEDDRSSLSRGARASAARRNLARHLLQQ